MSLLLRFNQLRNSMWSSCPARLLMPHAGLSLGKLLDPKSYERRLFSTSVQDTASLHSASLGSCISGIQPLKFQQTSEHEPSVPLLIFDIETTGYFQKITGNVQKGNRITEFAVRDLCGGKNSTFETLLNPERDVPEYLATVNNINTDLVCRPDVPSSETFLCKRVLEKWVLRAPGHGAELHGEERLLAPAPVPDLRRQETRQNVTADGGVGWSGDYALYGHVVGDFVVLPTSPTAFSDVLPLLLAFARSRQTPGKPVIWVAHNVKRFDGPFLAQEFDRCSAQIPEDWLFVDTYCLARKLPKLLPSEDKKHLLNLESLCKRYEISVEGPSHRAMQDVMALCHVFQKMSFDLQLTHEGLMNEAINASYFSKYLN
ncbi:unnamed protein product [Triticum turgidum subsp. durum]|uniref:Exonuclease domain-containing protein n=1 Tax=Triticum turgidum subsp. durum TaxID=4567 RepID=A0A9R1PYQ1_TRITD|nr:unnamed protein product [Triticum turgidum subsp. durum]